MPRGLATKVLSTLLVAAFVILAGCARTSSFKAPAPTSVRIAEGTFPASAAIYVAYKEGFFHDEGLDATIRRYGSGRLALQAALEGDADFATVAETPIALAVLDGQSPAIIATICEIDRASVIIARKDKGIASAGDLRGKRIGVLPGTAADYFLHIYLVTSGIDPRQVTIVPLKASDIAPSLLAGHVDAVGVFAPYNVQLQDALGSDALTLDQPGLYTQSWNIATSRAQTREDSRVAARFLRAILRANEFIALNPADAQAIAAQGTGIPLRVVQKEWDSCRRG